MTTREALPAEEILKRAHAVGQYFGFAPFSMLALGKRGMPKAELTPIPLNLDPIAESVASFLRQVQNAGLIPSPRQPLFLWHTNIAPGRPAPKSATVQFHAIGADRAISDAVLIRALSALTADLFKEPAIIRINSLGDKETRARFARELGVFFKKRGPLFSEECLNCAKRDVFEAAQMAISGQYAEDLPAPTDHLSDASRKRFEELLEYLEMTETPYELAPDLISRGTIWSETCFEITVGGETVVWGSRYGELARTFFKSSMPAMAAIFKIPSMGPKVAPLKKASKMRFAFVHIGEEAKHLSLKLADELRRARLPLSQVIGLESLTEQMLLVERDNPPYLLIMGRKEALEHSALLRNRNTQEEETILLSDLTTRLRAFA